MKFDFDVLHIMKKWGRTKAPITCFHISWCYLLRAVDDIKIK